MEKIGRVFFSQKCYLPLCIAEFFHCPVWAAEICGSGEGPGSRYKADSVVSRDSTLARVKKVWRNCDLGRNYPPPPLQTKLPPPLGQNCDFGETTPLWGETAISYQKSQFRHKIAVSPQKRGVVSPQAKIAVSPQRGVVSPQKGGSFAPKSQFRPKRGSFALKS